MYGKPWNFGQFESVCLDAAMYLLDDMSDIPLSQRGNPVIVSRQLSALVWFVNCGIDFSNYWKFMMCNCHTHNT